MVKFQSSEDLYLKSHTEKCTLDTARKTLRRAKANPMQVLPNGQQEHFWQKKIFSTQNGEFQVKKKKENKWKAHPYEMTWLNIINNTARFSKCYDSQNKIKFLTRVRKGWILGAGKDERIRGRSRESYHSQVHLSETKHLTQ